MGEPLMLLGSWGRRGDGVGLNGANLNSKRVLLKIGLSFYTALS